MSNNSSPEIITKKSISYTADELSRLVGKNTDWIDTLLDYEVIVCDINGERFSYQQLHITQKALRLQSDLELNTAGVALALQLIKKIESLENEIQRLSHLR